MPTFTADEIDRIAALAHLALTEHERTLFTRQLGDILGYAEQIREVVTEEIPPTTHVLTPDTVFRVDEPAPPLARESALANAPDAAVEAGLFRVPRVVGG